MVASEVSAWRAARIGDHANKHGGYPRAAVERAMKVQEVILRAMAKQDHVVAGGGDYRHQRPSDAALAGALRGARL